MCTDRPDFDVTTDRFKIKVISRKFIATLQTNKTIDFTYVTLQHCFIQFVVLHFATRWHFVNSLILQPAPAFRISDVKIGPTRGLENRLQEAAGCNRNCLYLSKTSLDLWKPYTLFYKNNFIRTRGSFMLKI